MEDNRIIIKGVEYVGFEEEDADCKNCALLNICHKNHFSDTCANVFFNVSYFKKKI